MFFTYILLDVIIIYYISVTMLCSLPREILTNIISNLDVPSRLSLRSTCWMMENAVTKSDLYVNTIQIEQVCSSSFFQLNSEGSSQNHF